MTPERIAEVHALALAGRALFEDQPFTTSEFEVAVAYDPPLAAYIALACNELPNAMAEIERLRLSLIATRAILRDIYSLIDSDQEGKAMKRVRTATDFVDGVLKGDAT